MKTQHPQKLKPRPLFSCGIFSYCTQSVLSPTHTQPPTLPPSSTTPPPPPPLPPPPPPLSKSQPESSSSSSSTSQSFTQWRFPLPKSPIFHHHPPESEPEPKPKPDPPALTTNQQQPPVLSTTNLAELFHVAELHLSTGSDPSRRLSTLHLLERSLVPNPPADGVEYPECPRAVMDEIVGLLKDTVGAKAATKVLLALCLAEANRQVAVEAGAVGQVVEALAELEGAAVERALAALELLCTVEEGAAELRAHALAVPMLVEVMGKTVARGKECAISALSVVFGGGREEEPAEEVARAVMLALQGECSARGRRKGAQLLRVLRETERLDFTDDGRRGS